MKLTFYKKLDGIKPAGKYIKSLDTKHKAKVVWEIDLLEKYGFDLKEPHVKPIKGKKYHGLYELRIQFSSDISRIFYFYETEDGFVILNGYTKKDNKTDPKELDIALKYMKDYIERKAKENENSKNYSESYKNIRNELFAEDKNLKKEYEALRPRYEIVESAIKARIKNKMTQEDVAKKMKTTKTSISRFESGDYNPSLEFLIRLSGALGRQLKVSMV